MTLDKIFVLDAARRVEKTCHNESNIDTEDLERAVGLNPTYRDDVEDFCKRIKAYYIIKWQCTDTWVGLSAIFLDDELVAVSSQEGRKFDANIEFVSEEAARKIYVLLSPQFELKSVSMLDQKEMTYTMYNVEYGAELLVNEGFYQGKKVTVVEKYHSYEDIDRWRTIIVKNEDGKCETISVGQFFIPIHITEANDDNLQP